MIKIAENSYPIIYLEWRGILTYFSFFIHFLTLYNIYGDLYLVLPALNLSTLDAVLLEHGGLSHVLPLAVNVKFFWAVNVM